MASLALPPLPIQNPERSHFTHNHNTITMKLSLASLALLVASAQAFTTTTPGGRTSTSLNILAGTQTASERVANVMSARPEEQEAIDKLVKSNFPGAISNRELETKVAAILESKGFTPANTLLCTSLCW